MRNFAPLVTAFALSAFAQGPAAKEFEAASIKPTEMTNRGFAARTEGPYVAYLGYSLHLLVSLGLGVPDYRIVWPEDEGEWIRSERFDIVAKAPGEAKPSQADVKDMVRALLAERFGMTAHNETAEFPSYNLVVDEGGPRLKEASADAQSRMQRSADVWIFSGASLTSLSQGLLGVDRPVFNKTGLTGRYDFSLKADGGSIFTALREQLGLRLVPGRELLETFVVEQVRHPSAN